MVWQWLCGSATSADILDIPLNVPVGTRIDSLGLTEEQALLLKHWQRTNTFGPCMTISPWGNKPGQWTESTRSRLAEEIHKLKHWVVLGGFDFPDVEQTTLFIDPPYQFNAFKYGTKWTEADYARLGRYARERSNANQVIVCEAAGKDDTLPNWLPFEASHSSVTSRRKQTHSHHSEECVWSSGPTWG